MSIRMMTIISGFIIGTLPGSAGLFSASPAWASGTFPEPDWLYLESFLIEDGRETAGHAQKTSNTPAPIVPMPQSASSLTPLHLSEILRRPWQGIAKRPLPKKDPSKKFEVKVGEPLDEVELEDDLADLGPAIKAGQYVEVTNIDIKGDHMEVDFNCGNRRERRNIRVENGSGGGVTLNPSKFSDCVVPAGITLDYKFNKKVPDMTLAEFQALLEPFIRVAEQTVTQDPIDLIAKDQPPDVRQKQQGAVREGRIEIGMDEQAARLAESKAREETYKRHQLSYPLDAQGRLKWIEWKYNSGTSCRIVRFEPRLIGKTAKLIVVAIDNFPNPCN